jgi:hypothetical protein
MSVTPPVAVERSELCVLRGDPGSRTKRELEPSTETVAVDGDNRRLPGSSRVNPRGPARLASA